MVVFQNSNELLDIRAGHYSAKYFNRAEYIMKNEQPDKVVTMQVFQKQYGMVCGISEVIVLLKNYLQYDWNLLEVKTLKDGDLIVPWGPVMHITGPYHLFASLESLYLGILARQTKVATNTNNVVKAAKGKDVLCFADRFDHYLMQSRDGYAAWIGGAKGFATQAMCEYFDGTAMGTMPHALIACYDGDVVKAGRAFQKYYPTVPLVTLVDFNNDCITDSVRSLEEFGKDLYGVRLDTSEKMIDQSLPQKECTTGSFHGVCPELVVKVRDALDKAGGQHVKIVVSGGFSPDKITWFESLQMPVDVYAVGSGLLKGNFDFTADIVKPIAKTGRKYIEDERLELVT